MTPQPLSWIERMKQYEPTKLVKYASAGLKLGSALGWLSFTSAQVGIIDAQLSILLPFALEAVVQVIDWLAHKWLRSKVSSPETAETLATAVLEVEKARGQGAPVKVPLKATRAAKRVLKIDPDKVVNPL